MERPKKMILTGALVLAALTAAFALLLRGNSLALVQALTAVALPEFLLLLGLVCTWRRVQRAALWCVGRLPNSEKWAGRKKSSGTSWRLCTRSPRRFCGTAPAAEKSWP